MLASSFLSNLVPWQVVHSVLVPEAFSQVLEHCKAREDLVLANLRYADNGNLLRSYYYMLGIVLGTGYNKKWMRLRSLVGVQVYVTT